jgi:large subunit ribosomal protein L5
MMADNAMREILIDKVTANIGTGVGGDRLEYAKQLLEKLSHGKPIETTAKKRNPVFKLRVGMSIGTKVTLRGTKAKEFVDKALTARKRMLKASNFDRTGNFSFGVPEYIDFPGAKYDPKIGMFGFDVCVTLKRRGKRVQERRANTSSIGKAHRIKKEEAIEFARSALNAKIIEE